MILFPFKMGNRNNRNTGGIQYGYIVLHNAIALASFDSRVQAQQWINHKQIQYDQALQIWQVVQNPATAAHLPDHQAT